MAWKKGQSGNPSGRRPGAKNKLSEGFLRKLESDWKENGVGAIEKMREEDNTAYVKMIASLVPKDYHITTDDLSEQTYEALLDEFRAITREIGISSESLGVSEGDQVTH